MKWRIKSSVQWPLPHFYDRCSRGCSPMTKTVITRDPLIRGEAKYLDADLKWPKSVRLCTGFGVLERRQNIATMDYVLDIQNIKLSTYQCVAGWVLDSKQSDVPIINHRLHVRHQVQRAVYVSLHRGLCVGLEQSYIPVTVHYAVCCTSNRTVYTYHGVLPWVGLIVGWVFYMKQSCLRITEYCRLALDMTQSYLISKSILVGC